jgi:hypothetical protein
VTKGTVLVVQRNPPPGGAIECDAKHRSAAGFTLDIEVRIQIGPRPWKEHAGITVEVGAARNLPCTAGVDSCRDMT